MPSFLDQIVAAKREELGAAKRTLPPAQLEKRLERELEARQQPGPFVAALTGRHHLAPGGDVAVIAEIKRASPSRGALRPDLDAIELALVYRRGGAAALSVVTERRFFQGRPADVAAVRGVAGLPVLEKDFIIDPYQVYTAALGGADALLLIAALHDRTNLERLVLACREVGLEPLVEVHTAVELERALAAGAAVIGINNRDLHTFGTDLRVTVELAPLVPPDRLLVSESGIRCRQDVQRLLECGVRAVLVGEALLRSADPAALVAELRGAGAAQGGRSPC